MIQKGLIWILTYKYVLCYFQIENVFCITYRRDGNPNYLTLCGFWHHRVTKCPCRRQQWPSHWRIWRVCQQKSPLVLKSSPVDSVTTALLVSPLLLNPRPLPISFGSFFLPEMFEFLRVLSWVFFPVSLQISPGLAPTPLWFQLPFVLRLQPNIFAKFSQSSLALSGT